MVYVFVVFVFFFFKQKTAYEMRISDWSSDVCSSDLRAVHALARARGLAAALDVADADVPARGRRAHRSAGRDERLWPARGARAVAVAREDCDEGPPFGLHPAAEDHVGDRPCEIGRAHV